MLDKKKKQLSAQEIDRIENKLIDEHIDKEIAKSNAERALEILKSGEAVDYILETFHTVHVGDEDVAKLLLLCIACQSIKDAQGLQASITGTIGFGKTDCCRVMLNLLPEGYGNEVDYSKKGIFYDELLISESVIFIDDARLTKDFESIIKKATSNFQNYTERRIKGRTLFIPERVSWWLTQVDEKFGDELANRMFSVPIDESIEHLQNVEDVLKENAMKDKNYAKNKLLNESRVQISQEIFRIIKSDGLFEVKIPYADNIEFKDKKDTRSKVMFFDFIKAFTVFRYRQRIIDERGYLTAKIEDYFDASNLFNKYKAPQNSIFKPHELKIYRILKNNPMITVNDIGVKSNYSITWVRTTLKSLEKKLIDFAEFKRYPTYPPGGGVTYKYSLKNVNTTFDLENNEEGAVLLNNIELIESYEAYIIKEFDEKIDKIIDQKIDEEIASYKKIG